ncbi:MAG TPA: hypothetical protein DCQ31_05790 [Bacteroidales bacterium]|nr:hypothetical protein [Bacteroidales bacterium]
MTNFDEFIKKKDFAGFKVLWNQQKNEIPDIEKINFLAKIVQFNYSDEEFPFFSKVFKLIIDKKLNLNCSIDHPACSLLALSISVPSRILFHYFLKNGAKVNFVGDYYAFESEEFTKKEMEHGEKRYFTCLDYAEGKLFDYYLLFHYEKPNLKDFGITDCESFDKNEMVTVSKFELCYIFEQANYLHDLMLAEELVSHLKSIGAKLYDEMTDAEKKLNS